MAKFLAELTPRVEINEQKEEWIIFVDGSMNRKGGGIGVVAIGSNQEKIKHTMHLPFLVTNNEAKYEVFLVVLRIAKFLKIQRLTIHTNSQLVVKQGQWTFCIKDTKMMAYAEAVKVAMMGQESIKVELIDKANNEEVDALAVIGETPCPVEGRQIQVKIVTSSISNSLKLNLIDQDTQDIFDVEYDSQNQKLRVG